MKILFVLDKTFPPDPRVENELITLAQSGHQLTIFCFRHSKILKEIEVSKNNYLIFRLYVSEFLYKFSALAYTVPIYSIIIGIKLRKFLRHRDFDVIHVHDVQAACFVPWIKKYKLVLDFHEFRSEIMREYSHVNTTLGKLLISPERWRRAEIKYATKCDRLIVVTNEAKKIVNEELKIDISKIIVTPNSVSIDYSGDTRVQWSDAINILYLGDTGERRGLMTALLGLKILRNNGLNVRLTIVGNSTFDVKLKRTCADLKLEPYVNFEGWQAPEKLHNYLRFAHVGISPLYRNKHHDTTYANKLMQYLAYGLPILVSDCTSQKNLIQKYKCGVVHKAADPNSFASQLIKIVKSEDLYTELSYNALTAFRNDLNWEKVGQSLISEYAIIEKELAKTGKLPN